MRINKFLAQCGVASRRKSDELIIEGKVTVNGLKAKPAQEVNPELDCVKVNGKEIIHQTYKVVYLLNKPKGYICSNNDEFGRKSVFDLLPKENRLFTVGRLDYDSEGLLLVTNDGDLANQISHPKFETEKKYVVNITSKFSDNDLRKIKNGIVIEGEKYKVASIIQKPSLNNKTYKYEVILTEGKNREIRKIFDSFNVEIKMLKRVGLASLKLGGLNRGEYRILKPFEIKTLTNSIQNKESQ